MKLITGIEAIQSGKFWKHKDWEEWLSPYYCLGALTSADLLNKEFVIKEEPREFWIRASDVDKTCKYCGTPISITNLNLVAEGEWIRVREIEE